MSTAIEQARELFKDEVVTNAISRDVELPYGAGTAVLITLDNGHDHTKPNTFGPGGLLSLDAAIEAAKARTDIVAVAVTGKPFIFAVGADLTGVPAIQTHEQAEAIGKLGHDTFRKLGELDVPTFALVNGAAMGGGVEVALHCTYRTISSGVPAFALPEAFLGLVPGWGGTYLLPNLIGAEKALKLIVDNPLAQNKMIKGPQVFEMGIADAIFDPADFVEESLRWAAKVLKGDVTVERPEVDKGEAWDNAVNMARFVVEGKLHGAAPAPARAVELVAEAKNRSRDEGFAAEDEALADLIMSPELKAGLYAFDLVQKRAKRPAGAPDKSLARKVTKVGVVGAGLMAGQLALLFARRLDVPVVMTDLDQERLDKGVAYVHGEVDKLLKKGRVNQDKANHLKALVTGSLTKDAFSDADFVIEAVFERMDIKKQVFAEVEAVVSPEAILATNTSSLSITEMASGLRHPERVVGFHFFNPVAVLPLLEIIRGDKTDDASLATAFAVSKKLKKTSVLCKDAPAFVVNRLLTLFMGEVLGAVAEGTEPEVADRAVAPLGLPMSPLMLLQLVGPAVGLHVAETLNEAFPERFAVSPQLKAVVDAGKTAIFAPDLSIDPEVKALLAGGDSPSEESAILDRALRALAKEIHLMLEEGVVAEAADIDLCLITGAGWPFHTGGITPYLDKVGVSTAVNGKPFHEGDPKAF
ncbi:3-hydroxyacyl-CoA dehydrogenase NAD-binding domain-containing protein [Nocardiopsis alba]|uniref:Enoyl-CoA hydratase/isomerase family protein n=1 Tax=Nocardiopsis alba (strain ATCC BAA-2165 / BE74) TaxID=1205910 RepID=J7LF31_NOCAA|nr:MULTISPECIES: 3-hydroxyacyl-CoA dehydrogenase NAD-binding domain-containing protein [Nocardiopsis]AFR09157.1 enoyl-CoA hydratase/isomerase family protein [Nocardiopsis alba ATCC BAA-2165]MEC3894467.1 3-hydroxyacyl-CoA dehydrogenase NAD-binding domain-containing protein [Nocardiopsis sp. LDBS1602]